MTRARSESNKPWALVVFCTGLLIYLMSLDFGSSGDALYYANIIDTNRFDQLTLHQGYYVIGLVFSRVFAWFFGFTTDQSLTAMNAVFGAGMLAVAYELLTRYLNSSRDALLGVIMLLASHRVFFNATMAEAYAMQTFLIWLSFLLFEQRRFYWSGIAIGLAMWTSPLTVFFCLWFPIVAWRRGFGVESILRLATSGGIVYLPFFALYYDELLWGTRGLLNIDSAKEARPWLALKNFLKFQFKHYSVVNLLLLPALVAFRRERNLAWMTIALVIPNLYLLPKLYSEDNVFISTLDLIFVCWFMVGWQVLRAKSIGWIAAAFLIVQVSVFGLSQGTLLRTANFEYREEMRQIGEIVSREDDPVIFADWARLVAFVYYNRDEASFPLEAGEWFHMVLDVAKLDEIRREDVIRHDAIFVIESYKASGYSELYLSDQALAERFESNSIRRLVERSTELTCETALQGHTALYRCRQLP